MPDRDPENAPRRRPAQTAAPTAKGAASGAASHAAHGAARLGTSWRALSGEYRLAAAAAIGLFVSMFLPWYEQTTTVVVRGKLTTDSSSLSAFQAFSWVEAAVLVVAVAVLALCFTRGEQRSYHLPGGDGTVLAAGGVWVVFLVFIRFIDKADVQATAVGVTWGIFITLLFGLLLAYAGLRLRNAHRPEPEPLDEAMATGRAPRERPRAAAPAPVPAREPEPDTPSEPHDTRVMLPDEAPTQLEPKPAPGPGEQLRLDD